MVNTTAVLIIVLIALQIVPRVHLRQEFARLVSQPIRSIAFKRRVVA